MSNDQIKNVNHMDAVEYTKEILKMSSSIEEIIINANELIESINEETKK